jgi:hypothetical protein
VIRLRVARVSILAAAAAALAIAPSRAAATTYYVTPTGRDAASGTSPAEAWQTIARVNAAILAPGDRVRFQGGARFTGPLEVGAGESGIPTAPITFDSYGTGRATIDGGDATAVHVYDAGGIVLANLVILGSGRTINRGSGVDFFNDLPGDTKLRFVRIRNVEVTGFGDNGIMIGGWNGASGFEDVQVTRSSLHDNGRAGLVTYGPPFQADAPAYANGSVYVGYVRAYWNAGVREDLGRSSGSGITLGSVSGGTIERSVAYDNGPLCRASGCGAGIWTYDSTEVTIQFDESYRNRTGGLADGDGFDLDQNTSRSVVQYTYSHDNDGAGYLLFSARPNTSHTGNTIRYNVSQNDGRRNGYGAIYGDGYIHDDAIYSNTVYLSAAPVGRPAPAAALFLAVGGGVTVRNNIFHVAGGVTMVSASPYGPDALVFQQNDYYSSGAVKIVWGPTVYTSLAEWRAATGQEHLGSTATGLDVDPRLVRPGGGGVIGDPDRLASLTAYRLRFDTPLLGLGLDLPGLFDIDTGRRDYYGVPVPSGNGPELGASESG